MKFTYILGGRGWGKTAASKLFLIDEIETELINLPKIAGISLAVADMLADRVPIILICRELRSQGRDNEDYMARVLGETLWNKIKNICDD